MAGARSPKQVMGRLDPDRWKILAHRVAHKQGRPVKMTEFRSLPGSEPGNLHCNVDVCLVPRRGEGA